MEYRRKCKTCGKIWCYTDNDLKANKQNNAMATISAIGGIAAAIGGTPAQQYLNYDMMERNKDKVVNYEQCPSCNSLHSIILSDEEWKAEQVKESFAGVRVNVNANATTEALLKRVELFLEDGEWATANAYCDSILDAEPENPNAYLYKLMAEFKVKKVELLKELKEPFGNNNNYKKAIRFADETLATELTGYIKTINDRNENRRLQKIYNEGKAIMDGATTSETYLLAARKLSECSRFHDASDLILVCKTKAEEYRIIEEKERIAREKEEKRLAEIARKEAEARAKKTKKIAMIVVPVVCMVVAIALLATTVIIPNSKYKEAVALMDAGKYEEAYGAFVAMDGYKDSTEKAESIYIKYKKEVFNQAEIGDYITFGTYEQDNDDSNGKEDIEWKVLAKEDNRILVISKFGLANAKFYSSFHRPIDYTWKNSTLRTWLNSEFLDTAFSSKEKEMIASVLVSPDKNPYYKTNPGKATRDQVFVLSIKEAEQYFSSDNERVCIATAYAIENNLEVYDDAIGNCSWWLRSPGEDSESTSEVFAEGSIHKSGASAEHNTSAARPAMWIKLN